MIIIDSSHPDTTEPNIWKGGSERGELDRGGCCLDRDSFSVYTNLKLDARNALLTL